jgi:hypothetical protein
MYPPSILLAIRIGRTRSISSKPRSFRAFPEHGWKWGETAGTSRQSISLDNSPMRLEPS